MTTVITRYFESAAQAHRVKDELLYRQRVPRGIMRVYENAETLPGHLTNARVDPATIEAYTARVQTGGAVLVVFAGFKPLGVAKITRNLTASMGAVDMGGLIEEISIKDDHKPLLSVYNYHPHMLSRQIDSARRHYHMADWPIPLINRRKPFARSLFKTRHAYMANFPLPLISRRKPYSDMIYVNRHQRMAEHLLPLLSDRKPYTRSMISLHGRMANFPIGLISKRKPYTRTAIGRHTHMANWPFPHLINGKTGTNALMPGGPRMANFPIRLLSSRRPFTGSIFSRHARMANFPIGLISHRKPFTGSAIGRHARMADMFLPLTIEHSASKRSGSGFSLSRMLGIATLTRR